MTGPAPSHRLVPYGDAAVLLALEGGSVEDRWTLAQAVGRALEAEPVPAQDDVVATYQDVLVSFDPRRTDHDTVAAAVRDRLAHAEPAERQPRTFTLPVVYGGEAGPDLTDVAAELGLSPEALVARHTATAWVVRFRASPVASPFCDAVDGPPWQRPVARSATPRVRVPAGSVALSGLQAMVYTVPSPGGWRLVGRTTARLVDPARSGLSEYRAGDLLRFEAVDR